MGYIIGSQIRITLALTVISLAFVSCTTVLYKPEVDEVRRQFHVPEDAEIDSMDFSYNYAVFGGNDITCYRLRFRFTGSQFKAYLRNLENAGIWKEVAFTEISPQTADASTPDSWQWSALPVPEFHGWISYLNSRCDTTVKRGYWFCNVVYKDGIDTVRMKTGKQHLRWRTRRVRGNNIARDSEPVIISFAMLDLRKRTLFTRIEYRKPGEAGE